MQDQYTVIGRGFFKKETDLTVFLGLKVEASTGWSFRTPGTWTLTKWIHAGEVGVLEAPFGKTGKYKVTFTSGVPADPKAKLFLKYRTFFLSGDKKKVTQ